MANNPEFQMQGISFVISSPSGAHHALPFKLRMNNGKRVEIQRALSQSFTVIEVAAELRRLADELERTANVGTPGIYTTYHPGTCAMVNTQDAACDCGAFEATATEPSGKLDFPAAVAGPTLHSAPVDSKPPQPK